MSGAIIYWLMHQPSKNIYHVQFIILFFSLSILLFGPRSGICPLPIWQSFVWEFSPFPVNRFRSESYSPKEYNGNVACFQSFCFQPGGFIALSKFQYPSRWRGSENMTFFSLSSSLFETFDYLNLGYSYIFFFDHLCRCSLSLFPLICIFGHFFFGFCWCHFFFFWLLLGFVTIY